MKKTSKRIRGLAFVGVSALSLLGSPIVSAQNVINAQSLPGLGELDQQGLIVAPAPAANVQTISNAAELNVSQIPDSAPQPVQNPGAFAPPPEAALSAPMTTESTLNPADQALKELEERAENQELFYDADSLVPEGEFVRRGGTLKVNPVTQPASRYVVVRENHGANSTEAKIVAASRAMTLGRYDSALAIYDAIYKRNKRDPRVLMGRAIALQHLGRIEESIQAYAKFLERNPKDVNAQVNMLGLMSEKYPAVALRRLLDLHDKHEDNVGVIAQTAVTYAQMGKTQEALKFLGAAAAMEPKNAGHLYNMAIILDRAGDAVQAVSFYEKALETDALYNSGGVPREVIYERLAQLR